MATEERHEAVERLCAHARALADRGDHGEALARYLEAWDLLGEPKAERDGATLVLAGVGEILAAQGEVGSAIDLLVGAHGRTTG